MRLIDADALWTAMDSEPWYHNIDRDGIAIPLVEAAPTIEAEPVKHGRWAYDEVEMEYSCSECGREAPVGMNGYILSERCHRCGARMDGGKAEETAPWCEECVFFKPFDMGGEGECNVCDPPQETWYGNSACGFFEPAQTVALI